MSRLPRRVPRGALFPPEALGDPARLAARRSASLGARPARGAAVITSTGHIFAAPETTDPSGTGVAMCAERAALYRAVLAGERHPRVLLIRGGGAGTGNGGPPCGACLQVLREFAPDLRIWWGTRARPSGGLTVRELLPGAFGRDHLALREPRGTGRSRA
jgi:cytidine deaminase